MWLFVGNGRLRCHRRVRFSDTIFRIDFEKLVSIHSLHTFHFNFVEYYWCIVSSPLCVCSLILLFFVLVFILFYC